MDAYAIVTMKYLNVDGDKDTAPAGSVFANFNPDEFDAWERNGYVRKATVGEVAEANASGTYRGVEADGKKKVGKAKSASKPKAATAAKTANASEGDNGAEGGNEGDDLA